MYKEIIVIIAVTLSTLFVAIGSSYVLANRMGEADCKRYAEFTGRETQFKWAWGESCYVITDEGVFLLDQVWTNGREN